MRIVQYNYLYIFDFSRFFLYFYRQNNTENKIEQKFQTQQLICNLNPLNKKIKFRQTQKEKQITRNKTKRLIERNTYRLKIENNKKYIQQYKNNACNNNISKTSLQIINKHKLKMRHNISKNQLKTKT